MEPNRKLALLVVRPRALQRALHPPHHDLGPEHPPRAVARRAFRRHRLPQRRPDTLPRHLDQPKLGHGERPRPRPVATQMGAQLVEHLVAIRARLHIDEVDHDDAADVAQPDLARDLARRLDVGAQNRALGVALPRVPTGVHVDRDQGFRRLNDEIATGRQLDPLLEEVADLRLDVVLVEEGGLVVIHLHARQ